MTSSKRVHAVVAVAVVTGVCLAAGKPFRAPATSAPTERCAGGGRAVDSAFIVEQARAALARSGLKLSPDSIMHVHSRQNLFEGSIVRMLVSAPKSIRGGGGLVWVDGETGCSIVLRRYE